MGIGVVMGLSGYSPYNSAVLQKTYDSLEGLQPLQYTGLALARTRGQPFWGQGQRSKVKGQRSEVKVKFRRKVKGQGHPRSRS